MIAYGTQKLKQAREEYETNNIEQAGRIVMTVKYGSTTSEIKVESRDPEFRKVYKVLSSGGSSIAVSYLNLLPQIVVVDK